MTTRCVGHVVSVFSTQLLLRTNTDNSRMRILLLTEWNRLLKQSVALVKMAALHSKRLDFFYKEGGVLNDDHVFGNIFSLF